MDIGIWDGGEVNDHIEFKKRIEIGENAEMSDHATLVTGTMIAAGKNTAARGMATKAKVISYDFDDDVSSEMSKAIKAYNILL